MRNIGSATKKPNDNNNNKNNTCDDQNVRQDPCILTFYNNIHVNYSKLLLRKCLTYVTINDERFPAKVGRFSRPENFYAGNSENPSTP